jgi:putative tryptophan/tyrosine transport system substrate-binding protein
MNRRAFIAGLGGSAAKWPFVVRGEQSAPIIGFLGGASADLFVGPLRAFQNGMASGGFVVGQNIAMEERWAEGRNARLPGLISDLVRRDVSVIVAVTTPGALAAKTETSTIPIVFAIGSDPVADGIVPNLNHPGGNITGATALTSELGAKRLELLRDLLPQPSTIALFVNRRNPGLAENQAAELLTTAQRMQQQLHVLDAGTDAELENAFSQLSALQVRGLVISADGFFTSHSRQLAELALHHRIAAVYQNRGFAAAGGLVSYGASTAEAWRLAGAYVARILHGEMPGDLPVQQATKIELIINSRTAKLLGIELPLTLLARADEVIE